MGEISMPIGKVFEHNCIQAVSLPKSTHFPDNVKKVHVRINGSDRILTPAGQAWDSFFLGSTRVTDDFMPEHSSQEELERRSGL
jgi:antitoxin VapB